MGVRAGDEDVVTLRGVTKRFDELVAVDRLDLGVRNGEFLALLGPSGCGKTTTLRMIAGFEEPTEGEISIDGATVTGVPPHKRQVNTVFQQYALFPHMTVLDNVAYGLKQRKVAKDERRRQAAEALELVRLTGRETAKPAELSGGMQQRVALARALVLHPKVLLLDEPLGALDKKLRDAMQIELKRIQRDVGITFIVVTHDQEEAMAMADRIAVMYDGRIDQLGGPSEIYDHPATPFVADFIGDMNHLEGTLARDGERLVCDVDGARFGIGLVVREAEIGRRVRIGVRPEEVHAGMQGEGATATVQTAMVLGHDLQVVARLEGGAEVMARQPRTGDDGVSAVMPGEKVRLSWSPTAALLLGAADADGPPASATPEPLELPA
jgi:spermidine/putrescine ABC transporter ATP-binding subunit